MLSDMHDKLSQAVKLYDQILTPQVAQPRRQIAVTSPTPYQQQSFGTGYSQWIPQAQTNPSYHVPPETPLSPHLSYASHAQLPQWNQPQYQYPLHQASSPPEMIASQTSAPPSQYAQPSQHQYYTSTPSTSQNVTSYSYNQPYSDRAVSVQSTPSAAFVPLLQPPPPTQYQPTPVSQPPAAPTLARANSVSYTSATPVPHIARNNTVVTHAPTKQYQRQQYQAPPQQQHQHQQHQSYQIASPPPAPPSLPQFPVVPTAAPQPTLPIHGSTIPSGFEERKEALLIDL
jgi:growth factor-regulated tyrosine kinase substrate